MSGDDTRETWATRTGFILAAVGSAVGLGNVWRFPFVAGEQGGAAFLLIYLLFVAAIGFPAILVEFVVGRHTRLNPIGALKQVGTGAWRYVGWIFVATGFVILSYYSVVAGWAIRYLLIGLTGGYDEAIGAYDGATTGEITAPELLFDAVSTGVDAVLLHGLFMLSVIVVVALGIRRGIELAVKVMVPAIVLITVGLAVYAFTLPGAGEAYAYYLAPDLAVIAEEWTTIVPAAAGQAFFTLSLGMGVMITYASYLGEERNLAADGAVIVGFDTLIAIVTGLIVFPVLFSAGVDPASPGAGAVFVSLASAFADVSLGWLLGTVFFATLTIAALSSAISIMEVIVSYLIDERGIDRVPATVATGVALFVLGVPSAIDLIFLDLFDLFADQILLVFGGLALAVLVGWIASDFAVVELRKGIGDIGSYGTLWLWLVRTLVIAALVISLVLGIVEYYEFLVSDFANWVGERL